MKFILDHRTVMSSASANCNALPDCCSLERALENSSTSTEVLHKRGDGLRTSLMLVASGCDDLNLQSKLRLQQLVDAGADLDAVDVKGNTALMYAIRCGNVDVVSWLLRAGADSSIADGDGVTPLWQSVFDVASRQLRQRWTIIQLLLLTNCDIDAKCRGPLLFACGREMVYCYEDPLSALELSVDAGCQSTTLLLVAAGCSISQLLTVEVVEDERAVNSSVPDEVAMDGCLSRRSSLQHFCRLVVRRHFGLELPFVLDQLHLPNVIKSFILLDDIKRQ